MYPTRREIGLILGLWASSTGCSSALDAAGTQVSAGAAALPAPADKAAVARAAAGDRALTGSPARDGAGAAAISMRMEPQIASGVGGSSSGTAGVSAGRASEPAADRSEAGAAAGGVGAAGVRAPMAGAGSGSQDKDGCPLDLVGFATLEGGVTGGGDAEPTTVATQAELRACATASEPRVCLVRGTITFASFEEINVKSDKTILGVGSSAEIVMGGFRLSGGVHNVSIRNLTIRDSFIAGQYDEGGDGGGDRDGVQMDDARNVWIDHVHFKHLGDGMIDSRMDTTLLTVSWNILEDHNKAFGIGWTDHVTSQITIHHNWIHDTVQRNPSTDNVLRAHLFNNLLENIESYGNYARGGTNMVLQNSVFSRVKDPHYYDTGTLVAIGNVYRNTSGRRVATGSTFSFFDPGDFYAYTLDSADAAEVLVRRCAGPRAELGGGA